MTQGIASIDGAFAHLLQPERWFSSRSIRKAKGLAARYLSQHGDLREFWRLAPICVDGDGNSRTEAEKAMSAILARTNPSRFFWEDVAARVHHYWPIYTQTGHSLFSPATNWPTSQALSLALSAAPDGYVRERAIRGLLVDAKLTPSLFVILARLDDWVPQVRELASSIACPIISDLPPDLLVALLPEVAALTLRPRAMKARALGVALERLNATECRQWMLDAFRSEVEQLRRAALAVVLTRPASPDSYDFVVAANPGDTFLRGRLASHFLPQSGLPLDRLRLYLTDKAPSLRCAALQGIAEADLPLAQAEIEHAILDPSHRVRSVAQFRLRAQPDRILSVARSALDRNPRATTAVAALHAISLHSSAPDDMALVRSWSADASRLLKKSEPRRSRIDFLLTL